MIRLLEKDGMIRALDLLEQAIERDPRYGSALVEAASRHFEMHVNGWSEAPEVSRRKATELARRALQVAGDDPNVLSKAAYALGYFGEEIDAATALRRRKKQSGGYALTNVVLPSCENWRNPERRELYLSGLRLAAGEAE